MRIKNKLLILLIGGLSICLFSAFGFQIDVAGGINKDGGTADVSLVEPLKVAADEANAALEAAQFAADLAKAALATAQFSSGLANAALEAAQSAADLANAALLEAIEGGDVAALAAAQAAANLANDDLATAQSSANLANIALATAQSSANLANAALIAAQQKADDANAALEESISEEIKISHIITNSNNGGSFIIGEEGNHSLVYGEVLPFTFASEEGFGLVWLRIGNIKITAADGVVLIPYLESFNKKNLTIHAQFKKDKDYVPETTAEGISSDEETLQGDTDSSENVKENSNENGKEDSNENGKEKSNNGKKK